METDQDTIIIWEVFTENGGHWDVADSREEAEHKANVLAQRLKQTAFYRKQLIVITGPWPVHPQQQLLEEDS